MGARARWTLRAWHPTASSEGPCCRSPRCSDASEGGMPISGTRPSNVHQDQSPAVHPHCVESRVMAGDGTESAVVDGTESAVTVRVLHCSTWLWNSCDSAARSTVELSDTAPLAVTRSRPTAALL